MINMQPGGRFSISKSPQNLPSKCVVCGAWGGDGRDFVDFGFDIDFYGTVYFCSVCLTECCNKLGYISPSQWTIVNEMNEGLIQRVQTVEADNVLLRSALASTDFLRGGNTSDFSVANTSGVEDERSDLSFEGSTSESELFSGENNSEKGSDDPKSNGSIDERRSEDLSDSFLRDEEFDFRID